MSAAAATAATVDMRPPPGKPARRTVHTMTAQAFAAAALGWHDFFLAVAGASAALLGLLFVGVSINLSTIAADERVDLRVRASQAFSNLLAVLVIALLMLIPDPDPQPTAIGLAVVAGLGLLRVAANLYSVVRACCVPHVDDGRAADGVDRGCRSRAALHGLEDLVRGRCHGHPEPGDGRLPAADRSRGCRVVDARRSQPRVDTLGRDPLSQAKTASGTASV